MSEAATSSKHPPLIRSLLGPGAYPHPVGEVQLIETHISWVLLTGEFAYKVKKPVNLGFLDFSTLDWRRRYCEEELRVNRRTAADLYIDVVPIGSDPSGFKIGREPAVEYAVRMRQFSHAARLDRCLRAGRLGRKEARSLAITIAHFHQGLTPRESVDPAYEVERACKPARNNFTHLDPAAFSDVAQQQLAVIEDWTLNQAERLAHVFAERARQGAVRECHGDLHLENLLWMEGRFTLFDAIEFNADLRWIDIANDTAFLAMDLMARGRRDLAFAVLSTWLEETGDYGSLAVLRFYLVGRSLVRALVLSIRERQSGVARPGARSFRQKAERYVELASDLVDTPPPALYLMHGLSGSGKTWFSERLQAYLGALRVRSDLERKRLAGLTERQRERGFIEGGLYGADVTDRTYASLALHCETGLRAGFDMLVDASFLHRRHRAAFLEMASAVGARPLILECTAPEPLLRTRVGERERRRDDASDATVSVLEHQLRHHDPLTQQERLAAFPLRAGTDPARAAAAILDAVAGQPGRRPSRRDQPIP
jgi:aminoglycoside phosphotransferase family enzyme/predicted kinase